MAIKAVPTINESLDKVQTALTQHVKTCDDYKTFYEKCTNPPPSADLKDLIGIVHLYASNMFDMIYDHDLENLEQEFQGIKSQVTLLDSQEQCSSKIETIVSQFEKCKSQAESFKKQVIKSIQSPSSLFLDDRGNLFGQFGYHGTNQHGVINECHCNELMGRNCRRMFSSRLVKFIENTWPQKKEITIQAVGPGGCNHELEIHALAEEKGYKLNWILTQPGFAPLIRERFEMIAQWATPGINVTSVCSTANDYFNNIAAQNPNPNLTDVFLFIDIDLHISKSDISNYQSKFSHHCLFADYNKNGLSRTSNFFQACTIVELNKKN